MTSASLALDAHTIRRKAEAKEFKRFKQNYEVLRNAGRKSAAEAMAEDFFKRKPHLKGKTKL